MTIALLIVLLTLSLLPLRLKSLRHFVSLLLWYCVVFALALLILQPKLFDADNPPQLLTDIDPLEQGVSVAQSAVLSSPRDQISFAQWQSFSARSMQWIDSDPPLFNMTFPSITTVGRQWELHLHFNHPDKWSAELADESATVIARADSENQNELRLSWLPVIAEPVLLELRIFDANKKLVEKGPIAIDVQQAQAFNVQVELAAPSFDSQALRQGMASSGLRWQVTTQLGANTQWLHQSDRETFSPNIIIVDSRRFEKAKAVERDRWLIQASQGIPLLIIDFSNEIDFSYWNRNWNLTFQSTSESENKLSQWPVTLARSIPAKTAQWQRLTFDQQGSAGLWKHRDQKIFWLALQGWHQAQIHSPNIIKNLWQDIFDALPVTTVADEMWLPLSALPLVNQRTTFCLNSSLATQSAQLTHGLNTTLVNLHSSVSNPTQRCTSIWPAEKGWLSLASKSTFAHYYIYDKNEWPSWQKQIAREAAKYYEARPAKAVTQSNKVAINNWILIFAITAALLTLWWRETKHLN